MNVYVISLPVATERRNFQHKQLSQLGLNFTTVDAVSTAELDSVDAKIVLNRWERPLMPTEVACFFSHYKLWQKIALDTQPALILEDDVLLSSDVSEFLNAVNNVRGVDHLSLEARARKKLIGDSQSCTANVGISRLYQDRTGAAAYILWPQGALKLVNLARQKGAALADAFICSSYSLKSWQANPALAIQSDVSEHYGICNTLQTRSYIQADDHKSNYSLKGWRGIAYKVRRIVSQLRQARRMILHIWHARRVFVPINPETFPNSVF